MWRLAPRVSVNQLVSPILMLDEKNPLLVRWQCELGRAAVFASDAKSRRDLLPHAAASEVSNAR